MLTERPILLQVWRDRRDVKLISALHTASFVKTKYNRKVKTMKELATLEVYNKVMRVVNRADQIVQRHPLCRRTLNSSHAVRKIYHKKKQKGIEHCFHGHLT